MTEQDLDEILELRRLLDLRRACMAKVRALRAEGRSADDLETVLAMKERSEAESAYFDLYGSSCRERALPVRCEGRSP